MISDENSENIFKLKTHLTKTKNKAKTKQNLKQKKINQDISNQLPNNNRILVDLKKNPYLPIKSEINQKNFLSSGKTYRQKLTNNKKICNIIEIPQIIQKHTKTSIMGKIPKNNKKNSLSKKNIASVNRNLYKPKLKIPMPSSNKENTEISQNYTVNYNNIKNDENIDITNNNDISDNEEQNNSLHSYIPSSENNSIDMNNFHENPSNSKTPDTNSNINALNNDTTKINTENLSDLYSTFQFLQKPSKETLDGSSTVTDFLENKNDKKNEINEKNENSPKLNKINKRPSFPNMISKKPKNNFYENNFCTSLKRKKVKINHDNFYPKDEFLRNQNKTCRNNKFRKLNNNSTKSFTSSNSMYDLKSGYIKKNSNYNYLKTVDNQKNKNNNKNNSVERLNNLNQKISEIKLDDLTKKYNQIKIKLNFIKKNVLFNTNTSKKNNKKKLLCNSLNNSIYNKNNKKIITQLEDRKTLNNTFYNPKIFIHPDDRKTINNISFIYNNYNNTKNSEKDKKTNKNIKKNSKLKLDVIIPKNTSQKDSKTQPITTKEEKEIQTDIEKSPISRLNKRTNFIPKEYPNMAKKINKNFIPPNFIKEEKIIKNINVLCKRGYSGPDVKKLNQDNYFIYRNFLNIPSYIYMGICDGHGIFGQNISDYLVEHLPKNLNKNFLNEKIYNLKAENIFMLSNIIEKTFIQTNNFLNNDERIDSSLSGSTCVSLIFTPERIICINVGDSRCILAKKNEKNLWSTLNLSRDHKPSDPDEKERIQNNGGIVESFRDDEGNFIGPERVWLEDEESPGLAMSRSFGDEIAHKVGVIVSPEIFDYKLLKNDLFVVIASDGVWEFLSSEEVVGIVKNFYEVNDVQGALDTLYNEACNRWLSKEEIIDDITVIIVFF